MNMICFDLEGVLVPEIWIAFSEVRRDSRASAYHPGRAGLYKADELAPGHPEPDTDFGLKETKEDHLED